VSATIRSSWLVLAAVAVGAGLGVFLSRPLAGQAQQKEQPAAARYVVVFTEGTNLCVTDNQTSKLYFYTADQGKEPGSDLKLRGTVDLTQVGKDVIKPTLTRKKE
jgi:hypothetical protein